MEILSDDKFRGYATPRGCLNPYSNGILSDKMVNSTVRLVSRLNP